MSQPEMAAPRPATRGAPVPDYSKSPATMVDHVLAFLAGFVVMFAVLFVFYKIPLLSVIGGALCGLAYAVIAAQGAIKKRKMKLRQQFRDLLEAMSVAMRAGNVDLKALESARQDLLLVYPEDSDIVREVTNILNKFHNSVPLSESFEDFAKRSGLEDIASFATIYRTIEGKANRGEEIVRQTQEVIGDKMEIEMEIDTLMTAARSEANIMLAMPVVIIGIIGFMGSGFMDAIYTTALGRVVATFGLGVFILSFILTRKFSNVEL